VANAFPTRYSRGIDPELLEHYSQLPSFQPEIPPQPEKMSGVKNRTYFYKIVKKTDSALPRSLIGVNIPNVKAYSISVINRNAMSVG